MVMLSQLQCQKARMARDPRFDGKFFILVGSTGIFCRPVCKVRAPLEKNVEYANTAVEAMRRGYRPCLRCRPDALPFSPAWQGVETSAKRAARLLITHLCEPLSGIAARLGVSPRYLHKLMMQYWQLAPKAFRIFHQLLLAKRLLHDSNMKIEEVAGAAGFSSARQLQHHLKRHTRLTPSQIRRQSMQDRNKAKAHLNTSSKVSVFASYHPPYNWSKLRDFFARRLVKANESIDDDSFSKVLNVAGDEVQVNMKHNETKQGFDISFDKAHIAHTPAIIEQVSHILDLYAQPSVIVPALQSTGLPLHFIDQGMRIPGICCQFEAGIRAILGQQVSVSAAITQLNRLQEGLMLDKPRFLTAEALAGSDLDFMRLPQSRKNALWAFAHMYLNKDDHTQSGSPHAFIQNEDFEDWLAIKGIGPWTINYVRMRATTNTDIWLNTDLIIKQKSAKLLEWLNANIDANAMAFKADAAAPWRSYLTLNLWDADL
jgi:AraC family transcriptional regulator of adaptative response / DNA-3-methyladenine glycosylase II